MAGLSLGLNELGLGSNASPPASGGGGEELLVNRDFATTDDWTLTGTSPPSITGGKLEFAAGGSQFATQTLVGGSDPAGDYDISIDIEANDDQLLVWLLGAGNEVRGSHQFFTTGTGLTATITASGEVSKFRISAGSDTTATVDNPSLKAA